MNADQEKPDELSPEESLVDESASPQDSQDVVFTETSEQVPEQAEIAEAVKPYVDPFEAVVVEPNESIDVDDSRPEHTLEDVVALLEQLRKDFGRNQTRDAKQQERIDKLHEENAEYKKDLVWSMKKELIESFIAEIDDVEKRWRPSKLDEPIPTDPEELAKQYKKLLKYVCRELPENLRFALESRDVFAYSSEDGVEFDPKTQRAIKTTSTDRPELNKTVKSLRSGYKSVVRGQETIIRPELVEVFKYAGPAPDVSAQSEAAPQEPSTDEPVA